MYSSLSTVKTFLGIAQSDTSQDTYLNLLLTETTALMDMFLGDQTVANRSFMVCLCDFVWGYQIRLLTNNITALVSINGNAYTGVLNTDYQIYWPNNGTLYIKNVYQIIGNLNNFWKFPIVVTCGYAVWTPQYILLTLFQNLLVAGFYAKENGQAVESYKLWDRSFTFASSPTLANDITSLQGLIDTTWQFNIFSVLPTV